jgi:hypothetical protein
MRTGVAHLLYYPMCPLLQCVTHALRILRLRYAYYACATHALRILRMRNACVTHTTHALRIKVT